MSVVTLPLSEDNMVVECCLSGPILAKKMPWLLLRQHIRMKQAELEIILADLEKGERIIRTISRHGELI
jgi:hypothetical protein